MPKLKLIFREELAGYPNNSDVIGFSPNEKVKNGYIVYYQLNSNDELERNIAGIGFSKSCAIVQNIGKQILLEGKLSEAGIEYDIGSRLVHRNPKPDIDSDVPPTSINDPDQEIEIDEFPNFNF